MTTAPLEGVRVLELTAQLSGPFAAMILADLGAEVIKIESPNRPDPARHVPSTRVDGQTTYYLSLNRNKRSVLLDLKDPAGHEVFLRLVEGSDVVLDNFRPGVTTRLGIDHERLAARNPGIVTCSLSGFGETGPDRDRPGYDYLMQALAGTMDLTGDPDGPPTKYGISVVDHVGGLFAVIGVQAALGARDRDPEGRGHHVDLGLLDTHLSLLSYLACEWLNGGALPRRQRMSAHPRLIGNQLFRTADGHLVAMPLTDRFFGLMCDALGRSDLVDDDRFADAEARLRHREVLLGILEARFAERTTDEWLKELTAAGVPAAPVQTVAEALEMDQTRARDMVVELRHPGYGTYRMVGNPLKISDVDDRLRPAPTAGQDTREVLTSLAGLTGQEIDDLVDGGVCGGSS